MTYQHYENRERMGRGRQGTRMTTGAAGLGEKLSAASQEGTQWWRPDVSHHVLLYHNIYIRSQHTLKCLNIKFPHHTHTLYIRRINTKENDGSKRQMRSRKGLGQDQRGTIILSV